MADSITLRDGRRLGYAEYGERHGKPVFLFHGMPGSRFFRPPDEVTVRMGVRLITADRPGYGLSTFQPGRRFLDWPEDILQLAEALGLQKFAVAGHSAGGPYAAACAYALPKRVSVAASLSGAGPVDAPGIMDGLAPTNRLGLSVGRFVPWLLWQPLVWVFYHRRAADPAADCKRGIGIRPPADDEQLKDPLIFDTCIRSEVEAFRPGLRGLAWDGRLLTRPWGFPLEQIRVPYHLWHGTQDDQTTFAMANHLAGKIPGCQLHICEDEAHMLLFPHWEEILTHLIQE